MLVDIASVAFLNDLGSQAGFMAKVAYATGWPASCSFRCHSGDAASRRPDESAGDQRWGPLPLVRKPAR